MIAFDLKLNDEVIGQCEIVRTLYGTLNGQLVPYSTHPDSVNVYRYSFTTFDRPNDRSKGLVGSTGYVEHRYGDDVWMLLTKALAARAKQAVREEESEEGEEK